MNFTKRSDRLITIKGLISLENNSPDLHPQLKGLLFKYPELIETIPDVNKVSSLLKSTYVLNGKVLVCGNGGNASDNLITAYTNDVSAEMIFAPIYHAL